MSSVSDAPAKVHQKPARCDDDGGGGGDSIPHTSFQRQTSSRASGGRGSSSASVAPADDFGLVAYELDPWDVTAEQEEEAMLHAGWIRKAEEEVCEKREWRQRDIQALREMVQGDHILA